LTLVQERRIDRQQLGSTFVYFSRQRARRRNQIRQRQAFLQRRPQTAPSSRQVIATLLELIQNPEIPRQEIVERCRRVGVSLSRALVDAIFQTYDLEKKRAR